MSSQNTQVRGQQQQGGARSILFASHSTASTSKMRGQNGGTSHQSSRGVHGVAHSEPPRAKPSYPAPSTVMPDDSLSVRESHITPSRQNPVNCNQNNNGAYGGLNNLPGLRPAPQQPGSTFSSELHRDQTQHAPSSFRSTSQGAASGYTQASLRTPPSATQKAPSTSHTNRPGANEQAAPSQCSAPTVTNSQYGPPSSRSHMPSNVNGSTAPSTARVMNRQPSGLSYGSTSQAASRAMTGTSTRSTRQAGATVPSSGTFQSSAGPQAFPGISIGVPPTAQMNFHYNQVDNRQVHIHNNAPQNVATNNNQVYNTDNSNHHNTRKSQANTYNTQATNAGNKHTNVNQKSKTTHQPKSSTTSGRPNVQPPSESITIRDKQYTTVKQTSINEWTGKRSVTYKEVPNDRLC